MSRCIVSCPGSLMLFGEHAILQGKHSLSAAIDKRLTVACKKRTDDAVILTSSLGSYSSTLSTLIPQAPFTFVIQALLDQQIKHGIELEITSEMSPLFGLGTSAAVTSATTAALLLMSQGHFDQLDLFHKSCKTVRTVQGRGSGADVAASIFGGIVLYRMDPFVIETLDQLFDITLVYSGSKMPTAQVIQKVLERQKKRPQLFQSFFEHIDSIVLEAKQAIVTKDSSSLGELCTLQQGIMDAMGLSTKELSEIVYQLRVLPEIFGSKISGSGLGDCAIGFGASSKLVTSYPVLSVQMSKQGVHIE